MEPDKIVIKSPKVEVKADDQLIQGCGQGQEQGIRRLCHQRLQGKDQLTNQSLFRVRISWLCLMFGIGCGKAHVEVESNLSKGHIPVSVETYVVSTLPEDIEQAVTCENARQIMRDLHQEKEVGAPIWLESFGEGERSVRQQDNGLRP